MLLQHHVIEGERIASDEIPERLEPMAGGRATVVEGDIEADNGVIHAIDAVLVPSQVQQALQQSGQQQGGQQ